MVEPANKKYRVLFVIEQDKIEINFICFNFFKNISKYMNIYNLIIEWWGGGPDPPGIWNYVPLEYEKYWIYMLILTFEKKNGTPPPYGNCEPGLAYV